ncbi:lipopolysaccharide-induced tumor necrosis factor-alpha factor homolog [Condylostylus longicornis]|uniref:lipopolysaccharide-induced tumor necrosis factor-alpha factor homolog n=1 Tax=Condylostylus longicornis TaxID=2530218 RepID=UPI00244DC3D9|nr:lipopolysaccharide-induced tumor necrosis factor-alpha factor homolog [Condylostylus longicornis]
MIAQQHHLPTQVYYTSAGPQVQIPLQQVPMATAVIVTPVNFGPHAQHMICPHCGSHIKTTIETETTWLTHAFAIGLILLGCILCSCLPYLMNSCKNTSHYCPNCNAFLGMHSTGPCK